jgi:serpin B
MLTRRQTLRSLGAAGLAAPVLAACGGGDSGDVSGDVSGSGADLRLVEADVARSAGDPAAIPAAVDAMAGLLTDLWQVLDGDGNLALSPFSIAVALAMTANGAAGPTRSQMLDALHLDSLARENTGLAALTQHLDGLAGRVDLGGGRHEDIALASANQLFGDRGTTWGRPFLTVLAKEYGAGMRTVDFQNHPEAGRVSVNRWTAGQTHDRIPQILPAGSVDPSTRLVLVNALYLKAAWADPFEKAATQQGSFHVADGSQVDVPMMSNAPEGSVFLSGPHHAAARLPYAGGTLAMTVALPEVGHESEALAELLAGLADSGEPGVQVTMPRWTFRTSTGLRTPLMDLGMVRAFGDGADFTPMAPDDPLYVSDVFHQVFIAVDEAGTEAAAATAVVMDEALGLGGGHELVLDRPFLFVIHDTAHGTPLFVGRVADPS